MIKKVTVTAALLAAGLVLAGCSKKNDDSGMENTAPPAQDSGMAPAPAPAPADPGSSSSGTGDTGAMGGGDSSTTQGGTQ